MRERDFFPFLIRNHKANFAALARLILKFKTLASGSHWIFARGPSDGGGPLVFPQFELPDFFVGPLKRLPNVTFTTNPFRLRWYDKSGTRRIVSKN